MLGGDTIEDGEGGGGGSTNSQSVIQNFHGLKSLAYVAAKNKQSF